MKKVFIAAALAAMIVSCGSKGNKSAEIIAESESDSIFAVNDSTLGELQTYSYEGILPAADAEGINYQLTLQEAGQDSLGTYNLTTTYLGTKDGNQAFTDSGTVVTIIGIPNDSTAIVYQLISATPGGQKEKLTVVWNAYISGLLGGSGSLNVNRTTTAINQAFTQSPYLKK